jgi:hypothetical protein
VKIKEKFLGSEMATDAEVTSAIEAKVGTLVSRVVSNLGTNIVAESTAYTSVGSHFIWIDSRNTAYKNGALLVYVSNTGATRALEFRLVDGRTAQVLAYKKVLPADPSAYYILPFAAPRGSDSYFELQVRKDTSGGATGLIEVASIEFDTI